MAADVAALERLFLGLADKTRLRLLSLMADGPVSVGHLASEIGESQPKVSRHLAYLRNAGLVETTRDGKWIYYGLAELDYRPADSVFRCIVDELSENRKHRSKPVRERASRQVTDEPSSEPESLNEIPYDQAWDLPSVEEPEDGWSGHSDNGRDELDVFLL